jgi:hypothetical protein
MRIMIRLGVWLRHLCIVVSTFVSNLMEYFSTAASLHALLTNETQERRKEILKAVTEAARKYADDNTRSLELTNEAICVVGKK